MIEEINKLDTWAAILEAIAKGKQIFRWLERGIIQLTREDALLQAKAIISSLNGGGGFSYTGGEHDPS